jgi:hypothetical protein
MCVILGNKLEMYSPYDTDIAQEDRGQLCLNVPKHMYIRIRSASRAGNYHSEVQGVRWIRVSQPADIYFSMIMDIIIITYRQAFS